MYVNMKSNKTYKYENPGISKWVLFAAIAIIGVLIWGVLTQWKFITSPTASPSPTPSPSPPPTPAPGSLDGSCLDDNKCDDNLSCKRVNGSSKCTHKVDDPQPTKSTSESYPIHSR